MCVRACVCAAVSDVESGKRLDRALSFDHCEDGRPSSGPAGSNHVGKRGHHRGGAGHSGGSAGSRPADASSGGSSETLAKSDTYVL
jgi:hypothetical protein